MYLFVNQRQDYSEQDIKDMANQFIAILEIKNSFRKLLNIKLNLNVTNLILNLITINEWISFIS